MNNTETLTTSVTQDTGQINVREYRRGNQKRKIQRNWQHRGTQDEEKQAKTTAQYVLDTTVHKQTQIT